MADDTKLFIFEVNVTTYVIYVGSTLIQLMY